MNPAGTAIGAWQVGQFAIRPIVSATLPSPQNSRPHSKQSPDLQWSSSFSRQIGHGCAGLPALSAPAATAGHRADAPTLPAPAATAGHREDSNVPRGF